MKKFTKGCLISSLIILIVGVTLTIVFVCLGGFGQIFDLSSRGLAKVNLFGHDMGINVNNGFSYGIFSDDINHEHVEISSVVDDKISRINLEIAAAELSIVPTDDENISYSIDGYGMSAEVSGKVLYISSDDVLFGNCNSAGEVKIYIPRDTVLEEINMDLGVGDLNLESINVSEMVNINAGTGDIDIRDMKAETLNIDCGAGDVELKNMDTANLDIDCGCGDTSIEMAGREQDYSIDLSAAMGDIEIGNVSYSGLGTDVLLNEGASKNIFIDCALGSVDVSFEE